MLNSKWNNVNIINKLIFNILYDLKIIIYKIIKNTMFVISFIETYINIFNINFEF